MVQLDHLGYSMQHLKNKNWDFFIPSVIKLISKTEKMRKCPKTANFEHILVFLRNLFRLNFAPAVKLYFLSFLRIMMGGNLKSPAKTRNKKNCVKNVAFLPNRKVFSVKMYLKSNIRHTID